MATSGRSTAGRPPMDEAPDRRSERPEGGHVVGGVFWGLLRIGIGWIFLWAFLDKLLALGFATGRDPETGAVDRFGSAAWVEGGSPTEGFLSQGLHTKWFFDDLYSSLAGEAWVDWVYMLSMATIGILLMLGIATRLAAIGGIIWMVLFYTASAIWPENNPIIDDHVIEAVALAGIAYVGAGRYLGLGRWWERTSIVRRVPLLR